MILESVQSPLLQRLHGGVDLVQVAATNLVGDRRQVGEHLHDHAATRPVRAGNQLLSQDEGQAEGELRRQLLGPIGWKQINDAGDRAAGVLRSPAK